MISMIKTVSFPHSKSEFVVSMIMNMLKRGIFGLIPLWKWWVQMLAASSTSSTQRQREKCIKYSEKCYDVRSRIKNVCASIS